MKSKILRTGATIATVALVGGSTLPAYVSAATPAQAKDSKTFNLTDTAKNAKKITFAFEDAQGFAMLNPAGGNIEFTLTKDGKAVEIKNANIVVNGLLASSVSSTTSSEVAYQNYDTTLKTYSSDLTNGKIVVKTSSAKSYNNVLNLASLASVRQAYANTYGDPVAEGWSPVTTSVDTGVSTGSRLDNKYFSTIEVTLVVATSRSPRRERGLKSEQDYIKLLWLCRRSPRRERGLK